MAITTETETHYSESDIITLKVGQGQNVLTYRVHEAVLITKSAFFRACLESSCTESMTKVVQLKEDAPIAVQAFVTWLYSGKVDDKAINGSQCIECYIFAEKVMCNEYHNVVMDEIKHFHAANLQYMARYSIQESYKKGLSHSPLASFGLQCVAYNMMEWPKQFVESASWKFHLERWMEEHEMCKDLTKQTLNLRIRPYTDPCKSKDCQWHQHDDGKDCGK